MCLAIPAEIIALEPADMAVVALGGIRTRISVVLLDEISVGDFVLVHVGYALHRLSPAEAERTLQLMAEAGVLAEEVEEIAGSMP